MIIPESLPREHGGMTPERRVMLDAQRLLTDKAIVVDQEALS